MCERLIGWASSVDVSICVEDVGGQLVEAVRVVNFGDECNNIE